MDPQLDRAAWREWYRKASAALEQVRTDELRALTNERVVEIVRSLVCHEPWRERPDWSGLVEQQRIFQRARKK